MLELQIMWRVLQRLDTPGYKVCLLVRIWQLIGELMRIMMV